MNSKVQHANQERKKPRMDLVVFDAGVVGGGGGGGGTGGGSEEVQVGHEDHLGQVDHRFRRVAAQIEEFQLGFGAGAGAGRRRRRRRRRRLRRRRRCCWRRRRRRRRRG